MKKPPDFLVGFAVVVLVYAWAVIIGNAIRAAL